MENLDCQVPQDYVAKEGLGENQALLVALAPMDNLVRLVPLVPQAPLGLLGQVDQEVKQAQLDQVDPVDLVESVVAQDLQDLLGNLDLPGPVDREDNVENKEAKE